MGGDDRTTHIVIPVADEPRNPTLPHALHSILTHTDYTPVTVGKDFGVSAHIPTLQTSRAKFTNVELAMRTACNTDWISDPFIWSNDDIFWTRPATPIRWALGDLREDTRRNVYGQRKHRTADILDHLGLPTYDYESHTPVPVTKADMLEALRYCTEGGTMRSLYGNLTGEPDIIAPDVKVRSRKDPLPDAPWASSNGSPTTWPALMAALNA